MGDQLRAAAVAIGMKRCARAESLSLRCQRFTWRLLTLALLATSASDVAAQRASLDSVVGWRITPLPVLDSTNATMRWPSLAAYRNRVAIAADMFHLDDGPGNEPFGLLAILPGTRVALPQGTGGGFPKVIYDGAGVLHLFWADVTQDKSTPMSWMSPVKTIWHSAKARSDWTRPERVASGLMIGWGADGGQLAVDGAGNVHALFTVLDSSGHALFDYRRVKTSWQRQRVASPAIGASITTASLSQLTAVFIAARDVGSPPELLFSESTDGGLHWTAPMPLLPQASAPEPRMPRVVRAHTGLVALWVESSDGTDASTLVAAASNTKGDWRPIGRVKLSGRAARLVATPGDCGGITAFLELRYAVGGELRTGIAVVRLPSTSSAARPQWLVGDSTALEVGSTMIANETLVVAAVVGQDAHVRHVAMRKNTCREAHR